MLYLDRITIHNFKSFRHANISFSKGFNCVVGPNGSGKSNICDALLFSLGESSLKRMRVSSASSLISAGAKAVKGDGVKRAYVSTTFTGDENIEISRVIKSNGKIAYRINGKRSKRQEVLDLLKAHKAEINETNTIIQGEITKILSLGARDRRVLIDVAAGIKEFDDKKEAAIKELEKFEAKINESNIMLSERQAFLNELEKEKADAERFLELDSKLKQATYTILKAREGQVEIDYKKAVENYEKATNRKKELENQIKKLDDEISSSTAFRGNLAKKLDEGSIEISTANKLMEELNANIKIKEAQVMQVQETIARSKDKIKQLKEEADAIAKQKDANASEVAVMKSGLSDLEKALSKADIDTMQGGKEVIARYSEIQKQAEILESSLASLNGEYISANSEISRLEEGRESYVQVASSAGKEKKEKEDALRDMKAREKESSTKLELAKKGIVASKASLEELKSASLQLDSDMIGVRESLAMSGRNADRISKVLKAEMKRGFYGRAAELLSCDEKYAVAVHAAAGSRLNYFIVDSVDVASDAIGIIKKNGLGRASFIPLKEITAQATEPRDGLKPLMALTKFDPKYKSAFEYVFSNTYLSDKIKDQKSIGKYRIVTPQGELLEQSGIVTGGTLTPQQLPAVLEAKLAKLSAQKSAILQKIADVEKEYESQRRSVAQLELELAGHSSEERHARSEIDRLQGSIEHATKESAALGARVEALTKSREAFASRKIELEKERELHRAESAKLYSVLNRSAPPKKGAATVQQEMDRVKELRQSVEESKVKVAALEKENEMHEGRSRSISKELKSEDSSVKEARAKIDEAEKHILGYGKKKAEIQEKIKGHSTSTDSLLKELQELDDKISKIGFNRGKTTGDIDRIERDLMDFEGKRSQLQMRLSDIKAELISYPDMKTMEYKDVEDLERQATGCRHEKELLGNVNLKAPEAYAQRKKDADEARSRMEVLDREKNSIMGMISEIESKKLSVFNETFNQVNENFKKLYGSVFEGSANLYLDGTGDPFNSKLMFSIQGGNNRKRTDEGMSGGERSILMLSLIFAIQMMKPMSFYIFDEIDVALDKENSKKLSKLIRELSKNSQFIVVSHNDSLITMAQAAIGVARQEGQSRAVGIEMTNKK